MFRYSSTINTEIKTASQIISVARTSMIASVSVSNCAGGRPVTATPPPAFKREDVNALNRAITTLITQAVTALSSVLLGLLPLYIGMIKKSTIATIVSSFAIAAIVSNSQGSGAGLMSIPIAAIVFGVIAGLTVTKGKYLLAADKQVN